MRFVETDMFLMMYSLVRELDLNKKKKILGPFFDIKLPHGAFACLRPAVPQHASFYSEKPRPARMTAPKTASDGTQSGIL